jgi:hypothetical protein
MIRRLGLTRSKSRNKLVFAGMTRRVKVWPRAAGYGSVGPDEDAPDYILVDLEAEGTEICSAILLRRFYASASVTPKASRIRASADPTQSDWGAAPRTLHDQQLMLDRERFRHHPTNRNGEPCEVTGKWPSNGNSSLIVRTGALS